MNSLELYVNKKFDITKVIKMVLARKSWGEIYTLYSTPTHEVLTVMQSYNFEDRYATFEIKVNEKNGSGYCSSSFNVYTDRKDYTIKFINRLLLKKIISTLVEYRKEIFDEEARKVFPYIWLEDKETDEWIEIFDLQEKVDKIKSLEINEEYKEEIIENLIDKEYERYKRVNCFEPREAYIKNALESDREKPILDLIEEINKELEVEDEQD